MHARIRRLLFASLIITTAVALGVIHDAEALESRHILRRTDIVKARLLSLDMRPLQEFSFSESSKVIHCRMNSLIQGEGFACDFHWGHKVLLLTSLEMDRIDAKLATYPAGYRIFLRARVPLECWVERTHDLDWVCRY